VNTEVTGSMDFLDEILVSAQDEAEKIISQAQSRAQSRKEAAHKQVESLSLEREKQLSAERKRQTKRSDQKISSEKRRRELQLRDRFMTEALAKTKETLIAMTQKPEYNDVLADWVVEAVLGLGVSEVVVNGRVREREIMSQEWLKKQEKTLKETYGHNVTLELSGEPALLQAGVIAGEKEGRLVYNNQVETRILRKQSDLRKVIYEELFNG
jgi:vacuolar-type H+-ATPase subunit E/Vma4